MKATPLETQDPAVHLIEPNVERDAPLSVDWLKGDVGRGTLKLMGVPDSENKEPTLEEEKKRVEGFISDPKELNWAIEHEGKVVGAIWVYEEEKNGVEGPSIHIMIGDPEARGKGIGRASTEAVIEYLRSQDYLQIFSRHLASNTVAGKLLEEQGFQPVGGPQPPDDAGLVWQHVQLDLE